MRSLAGFILLTLAVAVIGGQFTPDAWYVALLKPAWTPPGWVFAVAWGILYPVIGIAGWRLWRAEAGMERTVSLWLWGVQLGLNAAWSPVFFGAHLPAVALGLILALVGVIAASFGWFSLVSPLAAWLFVPYAMWILIAATLNGAIVALN